MKKQILNLGKALNKVAQRNIKGGGGHESSEGEFCTTSSQCPAGMGCCHFPGDALGDGECLPYIAPVYQGCITG